MTSEAEQDARREALAFYNWMDKVRVLRRDAGLPALTNEDNHEWMQRWELVAFDNYFNEGKTPDMFVADTCKSEGLVVPSNVILPAKSKAEVLGRMYSWHHERGGCLWRLPQVTGADGRSLYDMLGVPHDGTRIPAHKSGRWHCRFVGVDVVLYSNATKRRLHRVFIVCPECGREVDAGHYFQHKCKKGANNGKATK